MASTTNVAAGEWVTGTNIPANTTVAVVNSSTQITLGNAATGSGATALHFAINLYRLHIAGQSESGTIIRASQSFTGAMIKTEGDNAQQSGGAPLSPAGNTFDNSIGNLTVDANGFSVSGIDFLSNNTGNVRNVTVMGGGTANTGILVSRQYPGPCILENVVVNNFATGIAVGQAEYCVTMENITLSNQSSVGISNSGNSVFIRKLTSTNSNAVHAITNGNERPPRPARFVGDLHRRHDDGRTRSTTPRAVRSAAALSCATSPRPATHWPVSNPHVSGREHLGQRDAAHEHGILHASGADAGPAEFRDDVAQPADPGNAGGDRQQLRQLVQRGPCMALW